MKVLLAHPRGFCAGVERAVEIVDLALKLLPPPIYVRKEIVHNRFVVESFEARGVHFVNELDEVPTGAQVIFSAHGVSPAVWKKAKERGLKIMDATCPLVTKVHLEVHRFSREGYSILLIGHKGHEEVEGTMGEKPDQIYLVTSVEDARVLFIPNPEKVVYLTQTTLSVDDTQAIVAELKKRFPKLTAPPKDDICYATQNRQQAVKELTKQAQVILVVGVSNSSNSVRLTEVAKVHGAQAYLIERADKINPQWFRGVKCVGLTAGASAPETLVQEVLHRLKELGATSVEALNVVEENIRFSLPQELARMVKNIERPSAESLFQTRRTTI